MQPYYSSKRCVVLLGQAAALQKLVVGDYIDFVDQVGGDIGVLTEVEELLFLFGGVKPFTSPDKVRGNFWVL